MYTRITKPLWQMFTDQKIACLSAKHRRQLEEQILLNDDLLEFERSSDLNDRSSETNH